MNDDFDCNKEATKWTEFFRLPRMCGQCEEEKEIFRVALIPYYSLNSDNKRLVSGCLSNPICFDCHAYNVDHLDEEDNE